MRRYRHRLGGLAIGEDYGSVGAEDDEMGALAIGDDWDALSGEAEDMLASLSGEEIIGDIDDDDHVGLEEIIGAMPPARRRAAAKRLRGLHKAGMMKGVKVAAQRLPLAGTAIETRQVRDTRHRLLILPFPETTFTLFNQELNVEVRPQRLTKIKLPVIPSDIAPYFTISDVKVGQVSQYASSGVIPCTCWSEVAVNSDVDWDTANVGNTVTLTVRYIEPIPPPGGRVFRGLFKALAVIP